MPVQNKENVIVGEITETTSSDAHVEGKLAEITADYLGLKGDFVDVGSNDVLKPGSLVANGAMSVSNESTSDSAAVDTITFESVSPIQISEVRAQLKIARATGNNSAFKEIKKQAA